MKVVLQQELLIGNVVVKVTGAESEDGVLSFMFGIPDGHKIEGAAMHGSHLVQFSIKKEL